MQNKFRFLAIVILIYLINPALSFAAQIRQMEGDDQSSADISKNDNTRIKLAGDRIRGVKFNQEELGIEKDEILGEIYIRPKKAAENKPLSISVTSEQNFTYDLLLYPKAIPLELIVIKNDSVVVNSDAEVSKIAKNSYQQQIIALIKAMRSKSKLESYQINNSKKNIDLGDLELKRTSSYKGQSFIGESFILKNDSNKILNLEESMFFKSGVRAIKIENSNLLPKETTEIFIIS